MVVLFAIGRVLVLPRRQVVRRCHLHWGDEHLHSLSRSLRDKVDDRQQAHPVLLSTTLCQRKPPVLRRLEAASHHSLATVAPSGGAGENGAATPVTATTTTHYTIITIITATTNATLMP